MNKLAALVSGSENRIIHILHGYTLGRGYAKYSSTLEEAWRMSVRILSATLVQACKDWDGPPELGPDDDYLNDPIAQFGIVEAQRHRERGINIDMFLGLLKYYRQSYLDLVIEAGFDREYEEKCRVFVDRFYDRIEIGLCKEWAGTDQAQLVAELQATNRQMTNEKNKYLTIFESGSLPQLLLNRDLKVENLNHAAVELLRGVGVPGSTYYCSQHDRMLETPGGDTDGTPLDARPLNELLPQLAEDIAAFARGDQAVRIVEAHLEMGGERHHYEVRMSRMLDISEKFSGTLMSLNDVTDRKLAVDALSHSEAILSAVGRMAKVGGWELDAKTLEVKWTDETYRIHEVPLGVDPPLEKAINFFHPEDRPRLQQAIQEALERGTPYDLTMRFTTATGKQLWARTICKPVIVEGKVVGLMGTFQDITEIKQAEESLHQLLSASWEAVVIHDGGVPLVANKQYYEMFGYSPEEIVGKQALVLTATPESQARIKVSMANEESGPFEAIGLRKDGSTFPMEIRARHIDYGGARVRVGVIRDITERKQAEEEWRKSETRYRSLADNSPDYIMRYDRQGRHIYVNPACCRVSNLSAEEFQGRTHRELGFPAELCALWEESLEKVFSTGEPVQQTFEWESAQGIMVLDWRLSPELDQNGAVASVLGISRDITALVKAQSESKQLELQLLQAQKMEAVGTLAGGIAHDFNNILGAIVGYSEMALDDLTAGGMVNVQDLRQVLKSTERAKALVKQILAFSRKVDYNLGPINLNRPLKDVVPILERTLPKMVSIETRLARDLMAINADPNQIEQIILNMASNASDAMPEGGRLVFETRNTVLDEEYCRQRQEVLPGNYVQLTVTDTGLGMNKDISDRIFDPFFTTKEIGKGTGLGLSTVYGIVKSHKGYIYCDSQPGGGTTFKLFFPALEQMPDDVSLKSESQLTPSGGTETILLVDDEEPLRVLGSKTLAGAGYRVLKAESGEEALAKYEAQEAAIDLVIMDLGMPGIGGHKALKAILEINPQAKVMIASGYAANVQVKAAMDAGAAGFVGKPFKREELLTAIRSVLDRK